MTISNNTLNGIWRTNVETAQQVAQLALDGAENLLKAQTGTLRDLYDLGGNEYLRFWSGNSGKPMEHLPELMTRRLDFALGLTRQYQNAAFRLQSAFYRVAERQMPILQKKAHEVIEAALPPA